MAKVVRMHGFGGTEMLSLDEVTVPDPGPGEAAAGRVTFLNALTQRVRRRTDDRRALFKPKIHAAMLGRPGSPS